MPDPQGFLRYDRRLPERRPVPVRIRDWREVYPPAPDELIREQATRCMDCGVPFCHFGCPLGNRIPDWNDLVRTGSWRDAIESLHATNNFPEFTGRLCPAPCEAACVLDIPRPPGRAGPGPDGGHLGTWHGAGRADPGPYDGAVPWRAGDPGPPYDGTDQEPPYDGTDPGRSGEGAVPWPAGDPGPPYDGADPGRSRGGTGPEPSSSSGAVTIKQIEVEIINRAFDAGFVQPRPPQRHSGRAVAVVGSGPAGLAAAQQLARAGHRVTVYERDEAPGGLLRFGIPDFKLEKRHIDRRLAQLLAEGVRFRTGVNVGVDVPAERLRASYDAVLLTCGALAGRDTPETPGRRLRGVHLAMDHLVQSNRAVAGARVPGQISAAGRHVVIIGGGDTAADCLGVAHRQGALGIHQLDIYPRPPDTRDPGRDPWPLWPWVLRSYPAHEEGGERLFAVAVREFVDDGTGRVRAVRVVEVAVERTPDGRRRVTELPGGERELPADLVLLAIGFDGTEDQPLLSQLGLSRSARGTVEVGDGWQSGTPGVFVAGDMQRGASLIVWAIADGRAAAAAIHTYLGGHGSLPSPVTPAQRPLAVR